MRRFCLLLALGIAACSSSSDPAPRRCSADADCDDGVYCNGAETCDVAADACVRGTGPACDDGIACTFDLCDEARRACAHLPDANACGPGEACSPTLGCGPAAECGADADCDDGFFCNGSETCGADHRCAAGTPPSCDDGVACTVDFCDDLVDRCAHAADAWACGLGDRCTPSGCAPIPECQADEDCDDGLFCDGVETCDVAAGRCIAGVRPSCDDAVTCTVDVCDEVLKACQHVADATRCADGELCSPASGCATPAACATDADCDDGFFCNGAETCDGGRCAAGAAQRCDDAVACTLDVCDEQARTCRHLDEPAAAGCARLAVAPPSGGTVTSAPDGVACGTACEAWFAAGTVVTLTAAPDGAASFAGWSGACAGTEVTCAVTMTGPRDVAASFAAPVYVLSVVKTGAGSGAVTSVPAGVGCGADCAEAYPAGALVLLSATPSPGSTFAGWSGDCAGTDACLVSMDAARTVSARFDRQAFALSVSRAGTGGGTVTSSPGFVNCGSTCSADVEVGTVVTLTATADATSTFAGWSGACAGTGTCTLTIDAAKSVAATFTRKAYALTLTRVGAGTVASSPSGIYCGASCSASYDAGASVTLAAVPDAATTFAGWSGACSGTASCVVTMDAAKTVTATFIPITYMLSVTKSGAGSGSVDSAPAGISCGADCSEAYASGTLVQLTPTPSAGSTFAGWSGACSGTGPCLVTMGAAKAVDARFDRASFAVSVAKAGTGGGTVSSTPAGIDCGATCAASYQAGATIVLTPVADASSTFAGWSGACTGTAPCNITIDAAKSVTATFTRVTYALAVTRTGGGTVVSSPTGIYCGAACSASMDAGAVVTLTAVPDDGASFAGWSGACTGFGTCTVTMDGAKTVNARFTYPVTAARAGTGVGTVTSAPAGISCGASCSASYDGGLTVTLTAAPDSTSSFAGWSGACTGTGTCAVLVDAPKTATATFVRNPYPVTITRTGAGTVSSSPAGLYCGSACQASFDAGTPVTLTAIPDEFWTFAGWGGACTGTVSSCTISPSAPTSVSATFVRTTFSLSVTRTGAGVGIVSSSPAGIACGATCTASYDGGTYVELSAEPQPGSSFGGWSGACAGTGACLVRMDASKAVTALFTSP